MEKIENQWVIIEAGYTGKDRNYIDITKPYVGKKEGYDRSNRNQHDPS